MHPIRRFKHFESIGQEDILWNPQTLYHYTTREGLLGILTSGAVWATNIRFLNDASEFTYAHSMFMRKLKEIRRRLVEQKHLDILDDAVSHLSQPVPHIFIFCLSTNGDLLSQWRAYGPPGNGYAIGFDAPALDQVIGKRKGMQLAKVSYSPEQQWDLLNRLEVAAGQRHRSTVKSNRSYGRSLLDIFLDVAPIMKDPAFTEESEWRLVWRMDSGDVSQIKYRPGRSMLVPYVPIDLRGKNKSLRIQRIIIEPNPHSELEVEAVKGLCDGLGIKVYVAKSEIPFRIV